MEREIKFRVLDSSPEKDGFTGLMINHEYVIQSDYLTDGLNGKYPIMQYTGLKDKNGVEIYERDVIKIDGSKQIFVVEFKKGCFYSVSKRLGTNYRLGGRYYLYAYNWFR